MKLYKEVLDLTYKGFIDNILNTRGRFNCGEIYHERHHILPKCCGGTNDIDNLIDLFAHEHFIAHQLLALENPDNDGLVCAFAAMSFMETDNQERYRVTPEEYEQARIALSNSRKIRFADKTQHPNWGKHLSEETRRKIGEGNKGNKKCVGREMSEETRRKIGDANRNPKEETKRKMSESQKHRGHYAGGNNPKAKKTIRLSDGEIYDCGKQAADENGIDYMKFRNNIRKHIGNFMYYDEWLEQNKIEK